MESPRNLSPPQCSLPVVSLLVQQLHSHTFEQEQDLEKFIFNYRQKAGLRKQLSQALRTFLQNSPEPSEVEIHDTLEVLRAFVEKLYAQRSDSDLDYPYTAMYKIRCYPCLSLHPIQVCQNNKNHETLVMLGGPLVIVDVLLAIHRFDDQGRNSENIAYLQRELYSSLFQLRINTSTQIKASLTEFLLTSKPFISSTKALLHAHVQTVQVSSSTELLRTIANTLDRYLTFPWPAEDLNEKCEIVESMLRTAMGLSYEHHFNILADLVRSLRNCVCSTYGNQTQLCSVDGWENFLLCLLEKSMEKKPLMNVQGRDDLFFMVSNILTMLMYRLSLGEKKRLVKLSCNKEVCQLFVQNIQIKNVFKITCMTIEALMDDRQFVKQLNDCGMIPTLRYLRSTVYQDDENCSRKMDNILSVLVGLSM